LAITSHSRDPPRGSAYDSALPLSYPALPGYLTRCKAAKKSIGRYAPPRTPEANSNRAGSNKALRLGNAQTSTRCTVRRWMGIVPQTYAVHMICTSGPLTCCESRTSERDPRFHQLGTQEEKQSLRNTPRTDRRQYIKLQHRAAFSLLILTHFSHCSITAAQTAVSPSSPSSHPSSSSVLTVQSHDARHSSASSPRSRLYLKHERSIRSITLQSCSPSMPNQRRMPEARSPAQCPSHKIPPIPPDHWPSPKRHILLRQQSRHRHHCRHGRHVRLLRGRR
jgi:hypothetical protein